MNVSTLIDQLESFPSILSPTIAEWSSEDALWRPEPGAWSVAEIVAHFVYAEIEDFRPRLRRTLEDPGAAWTPIDPEGVVTERRFQDEDPVEQARILARERVDSVSWLRSLPPDAGWENSHAHASLGPLRAGDLLTAWTDHDALHLRQIAQRRHQLTQRAGAGFRSQYAGNWPAGA